MGVPLFCSKMLISDFDFDLPEGLIAQEPSVTRDGSRMLVVGRGEAKFSDRHFVDLPALLRPDDLLVLNNTRVFPARLLGRTETSANVETFLVREIEEKVWEVLARPAKRLKLGKLLIFSDELTARVIGRNEDGKVVVRFETDGDLNKHIDQLGKTPLPPYIKRPEVDIDRDRERYQTVYAKNRGAIAAPTAGLHFQGDTLEKIKAKGVQIAELTLHVGYGTFEPVRVEKLAEHTVLPEQYEIDDATANLLNDAKTTGRRILAVGTTTTRALESNTAEFGAFTPGKRMASLTITPGHSFRAVDAILTNFHLPKSSLLVLISVFGGHKLIMKAYRHAVAEKYRFYSYGDCMLIV